MQLLSSRKSFNDDDTDWIRQLFDALYKELAKPTSKTSSTVRGHCLHALGTITRNRPDNTAHHSERLFDIYLRELKKEMVTSSKTSDFKIIEGSLNGLHELMYVFTSSTDQQSASKFEDVYRYAKKSIQPQETINRYGIHLAGLQLLRDHASQYADILINDYRSCYSALEYWFEHKNPQLKHSAQLTIHAFLQQIVILCEKSLTSKSKDILAFFLGKFKCMINSESMNSKAMSLAIQGYGLLASLCKIYVSKSDVKQMFLEMMNRSEQLFLSNQGDIDDNKIHQLPTFISSLAHIARQIEGSETKDNDLSESFLTSLERLCVLLIEKYPRLHRKFALYSYNSIMLMIHAFIEKPEAMKLFTDCIVYQGLIRSCSYDIILGEERDRIWKSQIQSNTASLRRDDIHDDIMNDLRTVSYKDYVPLWTSLMGGLKNRDEPLQFQGSHFVKNQKYIYGIIFSSFLKGIISLTEKLDLSTVAEKKHGIKTDTEKESLDALMPSNAIDFRICVNLVDLIWETFPLIVSADCPTTQIFISNIPTLLRYFVAKSTRLPLVSGFYRILATIMTITSTVQYFSCVTVSNTVATNAMHDVETMDTDDQISFDHLKERQHCLVFLQRYAIEVVSYIKQLKDELLVSSLLFILNLPYEVACGILGHLQPAIQRACQIGVSFTPIADSVLRALNRWRLHSEHVSYLAAIVPYLVPYLHYSKVVKAEDPVKMGKTKRALRKNKSIKPSEEPFRKQIQSQVIKFFGSLGGNLSEWMYGVDVFHTHDQVVAMWDKDITIEYSIPFRDMKPVIKLDTVLPRVMEVAEQSANRQAKVSACELLHSITLYIIGRSAQMENIRTAQPVAPLYRKLFPTILRLACDVDEVSKQIFIPLVQQLIHWYTNNKKCESPDTMALLNSLMDGLVDDNDSSLRVLCSQSINEFLIWSIRQTPEKARVNAKSIFKRLYSLAIHPNATKRLGALEAFNKLYRTFREQEQIVDEFVIELIVVFLNSLALAHADNPSRGTQSTCVEAIRHLSRIINSKGNTLNKPFGPRRVPKCFKVAQVVLSNLVDWLFVQCGRPETECRHQCMELFHQFVKLLPDEKRSTALWIKDKLKHQPDFIISRFEGGYDDNGLKKYITLKSFSKVFSVKSAICWFDLLLCTLDLYTWVFQQKHISPKIAFSGKESTVLFQVVKIFVSEIAPNNVASTAKKFDTSVDDDTVYLFTPQEEINYATSKCTVITRILEFLKVFIKYYPNDASEVILLDFWCESLWNFISRTLITPSTLGFDTINEQEIAKQFLVLSEETTSILMPFLSRHNQNGLEKVLKETLLQFGSLTEILPPPFGDCVMGHSTMILHDILRGYVSLHSIKILERILLDEAKSGLLAGELFQRVFSSVVDSQRSQGQFSTVLDGISPNITDTGNILLTLAFTLGIPIDHVIDSIFGSDSKNTPTSFMQTATHSRLFVTVYSDQIFQEFSLKPFLYIPKITMQAQQHPGTCSFLLNSLLEFLATNGSIRRKHSSTVCDAYLKEFNHNLKSWWQPDNDDKVNDENLSNLLTILRKIIMLDARVCKDPTHTSFHVINMMYAEFLSSKHLNLSFKVQALDLLSFFTLVDAYALELKRSLEDLVAQHFPLTSREFSIGSTAYNDYSSAIRKLLLSLEDTGSLVVLEIVVSVFCRESDHLMSDEIQKALEISMKRIPLEKQKSALDVSFRYMNQKTRYSHQFCQRAITNVLIPMTNNCDINTATEFFQDHIGDIMDVIREEPIRFPKAELLDQLHRKILAYRLIELLFTILPKDKISQSSPIDCAFASKLTPNKASLIKTFMSRANRDRNENLKNEKEPLEERRVFHCVVYNAMIAAVMCTQDSPQWYKAFLFDENMKKNQYFLDNVIDFDKKYRFPIEMLEPLKSRQHFITIRKKKHNTEEMINEPNYMHSVFGSSLSEEVSVFDGNNCRTVRRSTLPNESGVLMYNEVSSSANQANSPSVSGSIIELESDSLNKHECMPAMVALLNHMLENNIGFSKEIPFWMGPVLRKLSSVSTNKNVKLFIVKLVINCQACFRPYASYWITPLVQTILHGDCGSNGINCMICDIMATVLSWNEIAIPEDSVEGRNLVQGIVENLSRSMTSPNNAIIRHNLDLIKTTLECWGSRLQNGIDPSVIYNLCKTSDLDSKDNFAGLQLLGVFLANGIAPYVTSCVVNRDDYFERLFQNILFKHKQIYASAAEVAGMALNYLTHVENESDGEIHRMVANKLTNLSKSRDKQDKFITCLHKIAMHFPFIVKSFLARVFFLLSKVHGDLRTDCLEIVLQCSVFIPDLFVQLKSKNLASMLQIRDESLQLVCLRLCHRTLHNVMHKESVLDANNVMQYFLHDIEKCFPGHPSPSCRQEALDIIMDVYDFLISLDVSNQNVEILSIAKKYLLHSLHDSEEALRNQVVNFWSVENRIPVDPCLKLNFLFSKLYNPSLNETDFLSSTVGLLLQSASLSPDFERPIYEHPLSECVFQEYTIDHHWKHRHASINPMFADTLQTTVGSSTAASPSPQKSVKPRQILATQEHLLFTATIDVGAKNTYNWMTGNSLDTFSTLSAYDTSERLKSALMVSQTKAKGYMKFQPGPLIKADGSGLAANNSATSDSIKTAVDVDVKKLRKRFIKQTQDTRIKYARAQEMQRKKFEIAKREQRARSENKVHLHRKYRTGELPDVQIPHRSIVAPLAAACLSDPALTKTLLSSLICSMVKGNTSNAQVCQISEQLAIMLAKSEEKSVPLVAFIQEVALITHQMVQFKQLNPSDIATASLAANKQDLGIVLLEQCIMNKNTEVEPMAKRCKTDVDNTRPDIDLWIELARLYKSLEEYDVLQGIFTGHSASNASTANGLQLEASGNYRNACKVYKEALEKDWDCAVSELEKDLWEDCWLNCLKKLSRWDQVNKMCQETLASYGDSTAATSSHLLNVWNHTNFQERYLESFLHSKLILLLQGERTVFVELTAFFDDAMKRGKERLIEKHYSEYLSLLYIYNNDYDRARYYLEKAEEHFAEEWTTLNSLMTKKKCELLRSSFRLSDIHDFLDTIASNSGKPSVESITKLIQIWLENMPHPVYDPISTWNNSIIYRCFFMEELKKSYISLSHSDHHETFVSSIETGKLKMHLAMIENAYQHNNFSVANKLFKELGKKYKTIERDMLLSMEVSHQRAKCYQAQVFQQLSGSLSATNDTNVQWLLAAYESLNEQNSFVEQKSIDSPVPKLIVQHFVLFGKTYDTMASLQHCLTDRELKDRVENMILSLDCDETSPSVTVSLQNRAFLLYQKAAKLASGKMEKDYKTQYKAYMALAEFCDKQLEAENDNSEQKKSYAALATIYVLKSMHLDCEVNTTSQLRFPRLLQLLEEFPDDVKDHLMHEIKSVPSWKFLAWIGHMVALLDRECAPALYTTLWRLAQLYPQAIVYPVKTAESSLNFPSTQTGKELKSSFRKLQKLLLREVPLAEEFVRQLLLVSDPVVVFKDWKSDLERIFQENASTKDRIEKYQNMYKDLFEFGIANDADSADSSLYGTPFEKQNVGMLRRKFAKKFKDEVDKQFGGSTGHKLPRMNANTAKGCLGGLLKKMMIEFKESGKTLSDYSPWLANFQQLRHGNFELEIPGQYDGQTKPNLEYHKTIVGFDERVKVMSSLRKPCCITIRGSDEKDYPFLVKGGEDLRQDQRIETIFKSINDILKAHADCWKRGLTIKTYQVVPVNSKVGLIEWVPNVIPYWDFLLEQSRRMKCEPVMCKLRASDWIPDNIKKKASNTTDLYGNLMRFANHSDVVERFNRLSNQLPAHMLRAAYMRLSASPEAFFTLRKHFTASYGTMCISHWLLGIGDRHTSNFLISLDTGYVVGIDFGHAFGTGTEMLPVPELIPFRLTRQLVNVLAPHPIKQGELRQIMVYCMSALRSQQGILLPLLDVFIKDPSVDWNRFAKKSRSMEVETHQRGSKVSDRIWFAQRKMRIVKNKLLGGNPSAITCDEIKHNFHVSSFLKHYCSVANGDASRNRRAMEPNNDLSVDVQVDCLIDQATDPNILGRMWRGWNSWL
ncbi:unnamed protein product [Clavelina lepadiformis]|uniref:DNA-dependent protein kinase catalytic subunit n=1 Tax=Clavelina lepadiformis TaxID=159417 RepID=A0ABP0G3U8_CLALP